MLQRKLTDIEGIKVGHEQDYKGATGCTVVLCEEGATAGVDVEGGSPGTRETALLSPVNRIDKAHGILLSGGSAFGLDAAAGIMEYLENNDSGFDVGVTKVPIVPGAILYDLSIGDYKKRPDKKMGLQACENATGDDCKEGTIGAGTGATVGKVLGMDRAMKGGLGTYCLQVGELMVGAMVVVNSFGDVVNPETGEIIAGALSDSGDFVNTEEFMIKQFENQTNKNQENTTIGIVVSNAKLNKSEANKLASMAHDGFARTMRPSHTMVDGDTIFTLATGKVECDLDLVGLLAADVVGEAVIRAVKMATSLHGVTSYSDLQKN
ncbi:P1 family peptidase [Virgibacillus sp. NKC19-16]|uniref:P1 family peptidase n=1 Tax=Virgibacillus salidurans TaxID=2831673 RepID=UPI001F190EE3|nr:P1 family peptidase [Virgibacillus sp. NKC19-16]UJL47433.1 P1 family peptidase [Virgibacillus sp. NKC19-16]